MSRALAMCVGPWRTQPRQVTGEGLWRAAPPLEIFIDHGAKQGVVLSHSLQASVWLLLSRSERFLGRLSASTTAHDLCDHNTVCLSILREWKGEDENTSCALQFCRTGPKTGAIKNSARHRKLSTSRVRPRIWSLASSISRLSL